MKKIAVLTGAGVSQESGIKTFRDADGLWEGHDVMEVASPQGWQRNPSLVLDFYNQRRRQLKEVQPNLAHLNLAELESRYSTTVITQNVDDLHERGGSSNIIHLHGELLKSRGVKYPFDIYDQPGDINLGDMCPQGSQLRPHIVWFGEAVPMLERAVPVVASADIVIIIGTSMQVYPAAGLVGLAQDHAEIFYIDPRPAINHELSLAKNLEVIEARATDGVRELVDRLLG
ncbi:MAG: NAD-dependent deacylase [Saprospiraceae bacterium]|nr:NAD-dependent deacylase [Saprospiraceae bacterium]